MLTVSIMLLITAFLGYLILIRDDKGKKTVFFDMDTTKSMRGFWSLIVLLVHIPAEHQNVIQEMLGSFAYIGVTFFFMTSSYGLFLATQKNEDSLRIFWRRRLPKLLLPMFLSNVLYLAANCLTGRDWSLLDLMSITGWVEQLLLFYGIFWFIYTVLPRSFSRNRKDWMFCGSIVLFSLVAYVGKDLSRQVWPTESFGFLYGYLLLKYKGSFLEFAEKRWTVKCTFACALALAGGVAYLALKHWLFFGDYLLKILLGQLILMFMLLWNVKVPIGNRESRFLGNISYEIYLLHSVAFLILEALPMEMNSGVFVAASILLTVAMSTVVHSTSIFLLEKVRSLAWQKN